MRNSRFYVLYAFALFYVVLSFVVRIALLCWSWQAADLHVLDLFTLFWKGLVYDIGTSIFLILPGSLYFLFLPKKIIGSALDKTLIYIGLSLQLFLIFFTTFAEFTFWGEFQSRFNFIAVDYLIYTYEVVQNINQSYSLPLLVSGMVLCTILGIVLFQRIGVLLHTFQAKGTIGKRLRPFVSIVLLALVYICFVPNRWAESNPNNYVQELSKNGIYSFFNAFRSNELDYNDFYIKMGQQESIASMRKLLQDDHTHFLDSNSIYREIRSDSVVEKRPNVVLITVESLSADFMTHFGNAKEITPFLDSLADVGVLFQHLYATGTRTVRGMEALTLSVPPTPGNSIVRRHDNENLFNIGTVFQQKGYSRAFFYGGDGYFDNMNNFFSGNGFDIVDRGRRIELGDGLVTKHTLIEDKNVKFENAWGICDEDLLDAVIRHADNQQQEKKPFFDFVMTTSNHRPYTYPSGKIDIPSGSGRDGAVKYTDYAIHQFLKKAESKPWFSNTVFVIVADHCASSAGKDAVEVSKYHIPCIVLNLPAVKQMKINKLCSQIDIFPTLFSLLGWSYTSTLFGQNVLAQNYIARALPASYQVLGYMEPSFLTSLSPVRKSANYQWNYSAAEKPIGKPSDVLLQKTITYYESAYELYKTGKLKVRKP